MKTKALLSLAILAAGLLTGSCTREELAPKVNTHRETETTSISASYAGAVTFDPIAHGISVKAAMEGKTTGYSLVLRNMMQTPAYVDGGYAVAQSGKFYTITRMETAQLSSTLTAIALLKVLEGKAGVSIDSPIHPYLPSDWTLGPNAKLLTFRHLLTHKSGLAPQLANLTEPATDLYENLQVIIEKGIPKDQVTKVNGKTTLTAAKKELTANYALMRILIPYLYNGAAYYKASETMGRNADATARDYVKVVREQILYACGMEPSPMDPTYLSPDVIPSLNSTSNVVPFTRYYKFSSATNWWEQDAQGKLYAGASRWFMSAMEFNHVLNRTFNYKLLSDASLQLLKTEAITMTAINGKYGTYYFHQGNQVKNGAGLATSFMLYPNGYVAVLFTNSIGGLPTNAQGNPDLQTILHQAYEFAMTPVLY